MTKEEAIRHIKDVAILAIDNGYTNDIVDASAMAIRALEDQKPKPKIFKATSFTVKPEAMEKYRREIVRQMEEGVVLLPNCFELVEDNLDLLDKIREEIDDITDTFEVSYDQYFNQYLSKIEVMRIIDKYRQEV